MTVSACDEPAGVAGAGPRVVGGADGRPVGPTAALAAAFVVPALLTVLDVALGVKLTQLLVVGPCIAAASSRTRAVAVNAVYVVILMTYLASPNHTAGTVQEVFTLAGGIAVGAVCVGITHRQQQLQRAVAQLEGRRTVLAGIVESANESMVASLLDGTITIWNAGAERLFGYPASATVGQSLRMLYPVEPVPPLREVRDRVAAGESIEQHESTRRHADGTTLDVLVTISPIRDLDGSVIGAASLARDLAPRKRAERERLALVDQVHELQRVKSIGQLAGGIAHDFNNLLAVIISSAEFIESEIDDPVAVLSDAAQVKSAAERAAKLTRQLLQFARGEHLPARTVDLDTVVTSLEPLLRRTVGDKVELVIHPSPRPPTVHADAGRMEQVLQNLVVNACDAMPGGGVIEISTEVTEPADDSFPGEGSSSGAPDPVVRLRVTDSGTGMTPEVASRVFEPFFTTKDKNGSTGLGLASVHGIITEARGHISVQTTPGAGSTFLLELPLADMVPAVVASPADTGACSRGTARVLVAEDEGPIRDVVARLLRRAGYEVLLAESGAQALRIGIDQDIDLLLSDVLMPGMSGRDLASALRASKPDLPILFMSGYSDTVLDVRGGDSAVDLLPKPFTERQLLDRVQVALDQVSAGAKRL